MNIWLINHYAVPPSLYPLARTTNFAKYLIEAGHTVTIFAASMVHNSNINLITNKKKFRIEVLAGITYVYVRTSSYHGNGKDRIINMFQFAFRLPNVCKNFIRPDVIIASSATPPACMAGINIARKYKCKCIAEVSDLWPESFVAYNLIKKENPVLKFMYAYEKQMYKKADKLVFTMEGGKNYIIEKGWDKQNGGPIDIKKVYHINNGVDLEVFNYNKEHFRIEDYDLEDPNTFKVIYTGSIRLVNNLKSIVDAAIEIKEIGVNDVKFIIYGDGNDRIPLEQYCIENNIDNIVFKGFIDKKYIPYVLSRSNLNIIHFEKNTIKKFGASLNKMFEYFASGKPIISDCEFGYDLIKKYNAGIVIDNADSKLLSKSILHIKNMERIVYEKMCSNGLKAANDYNFKNLTNELLMVIGENYWNE